MINYFRKQKLKRILNPLSSTDAIHFIFVLNWNKKNFSEFLFKCYALSKEQDPLFVTFDGAIKYDLEKLGFTVLEYDSVWTNSECDQEINRIVQHKLNVRLKNSSPLEKVFKVDWYESMLYAERYLHFFQLKKRTTQPIFYIIGISSFERARFNDFTLYLNSLKYSYDQVLLIGKYYYLVAEQLYQRQTIPWYRYYLQKKALNTLRNSIFSTTPIFILLSGALFYRNYNVALLIIEKFIKKKIDYLCVTDNLNILIFLKLKRFNVIYIDLSTTQLEHRTLALKNLEVICQKYFVKKILLIPHWCSLASLTEALSHRKEVKLISFPTLTVTDNCASIIGWENLDEIYCYGTQCLSAFKNMNYPDSKLKLSGNLLLSRYSNNTPSSQKLILIATSHIDSNEHIWIERVIDYSAKNNYRCVVKVHPTFAKSIYYPLFKYRIRNKVIITSAQNIYKLIQQCAICITDCSSVGSEALLLKKPILVVNLLGKEFGANSYAKMGVSLEAKELNDVCTYIDKTLHDPQIRNDLQLHYEKFQDLYHYHRDDSMNQFTQGILA